MDDYPDQAPTRTRVERDARWDPRGLDGAVDDRSAKDTYRVSYHRTESVSTAIVSTLGAVSGIDPAKSEPFYYSVDPDALDDLVSSANGNDLRIEFDYAGHQIVVDGEEESIVVELDG